MDPDLKIKSKAGSQKAEKDLKNLGADLDNPSAMTVEQRIVLLRPYFVPALRHIWSCFIGTRAISNSKEELIIGIAKSPAWVRIYELLERGEAELRNYVPYWNLESNVTKPIIETPIMFPATVIRSPWYTLSNRTFASQVYQDGAAFLTRWGISLYRQSDDEKKWMDGSFLSLETLCAQNIPQTFRQAWKEMELPANDADIRPTVEELFQQLPTDLHPLFPGDFVKKVSMVWDALTLHHTAQPMWSELDFEAKVYRIWHDFFNEYTQRADKMMECLPNGATYKNVYLFPDLLMHNKANVPCIVVENGVEVADFAEHKDSFKAMAEGRLVDTYTLSVFKTKLARCFTVTNGGLTMSVSIMHASLIGDEEKGPLTRSYWAQLVYQSVERPSLTLEYSASNFKAIIELFLAIYISTSKMNYQPRDKPISFTTSKNLLSIEDQKKNTKKMDAKNTFSPTRDGILGIVGPKKQDRDEKSSKEPKEPVDTLNGVDHAVEIPKKEMKKGDLARETIFPLLTKTKYGEVRDVKRNTCVVSHLFGKVAPAESDGSIPYEFQLLSSFDHPNILKVVDIIPHESGKYYMMLTRRILDTIPMRRNAFESTQIVYGVLQALDYLHKHGIVHADVKLDNVVAEAGDLNFATWIRPRTPYLIDFDIAFHVDRNPGDVRGTHPYIAPEVLHGELSPAMDMWGFGLLVVETFFGYFDNIDRSSDLRALVIEKKLTLPEYPIVESLFDLIMKCLELDPHQRLTAEQALVHPFFAMMKRLKGSNLTDYVIGSHIDLDATGELDLSDLTEEEKGNFDAPALKKRKVEGRRVLADITNKQQ